MFFRNVGAYYPITCCHIIFMIIAVKTLNSTAIVTLGFARLLSAFRSV